MTIRIENKLTQIPVEALELEITSNSEYCDAVNIEEEASRITSKYSSPEEITGDPRVREYRRTLWSYRIDPTKTRPSPEALLRRLVRGKSFPRVNCAVDMVNLASIEYITCIGLYDRRKLPLTDLKLGLSTGHEVFYPLGGSEKRLPQGQPIMVSGKIVIHLYPSRDSRLFAVDKSSRSLVAIAYGYKGDETTYLRDSLKRFEELLSLCGCLKEL
ncbi:MAG: hypothetical protein F7B59_04730 [Desulfurococcales archaeon]|nr:hypothetical protein [Desulfurococcales archaeon]